MSTTLLWAFWTIVSATRSTKRFSLSPRLLKLGTLSAARAVGASRTATPRTATPLHRFFIAATPPERWERDVSDSTARNGHPIYRRATHSPLNFLMRLSRFLRR